MMKNKILSCVATIFLLTAQLAFAHDFGNIGPVYPIQEENLLQVIYARVKAIDTPAQQALMLKTLEQQSLRPTAVQGISKTLQPREWDVDTSMMVSQDIKDNEGHLIAAAGQKFDPLTRMRLHSTLLFYDGDDPAQVRWAQHYVSDANQNQQLSKLILVKGHIREQQTQLQQNIYFDQGGYLTSRFQITHVPARVFQRGQRLHVIEEVV